MTAFLKVLKPLMMSSKVEKRRRREEEEENAYGNIIPWWNQSVLVLITLYSICHAHFPPPLKEASKILTLWAQLSLLWLLHDLCNNEIQAGLMFPKEWKMFNNFYSKTAAKSSNRFILMPSAFRTYGLRWLYHRPGMAETHWKKNHPFHNCVQNQLVKPFINGKQGRWGKALHVFVQSTKCAS